MSMKWFKVFDNESEIVWQENNMCIIEVNHTKITLAKNKNLLYAFSHKCPHAGGIMAEGYIDALGNAVCPVHKYSFSLQTGRNKSGEDYLKTFVVESRADGIYIGFKENIWTKFLQNK